MILGTFDCLELDLLIDDDPGRLPLVAFGGPILPDFEFFRIEICPGTFEVLLKRRG